MIGFVTSELPWILTCFSVVDAGSTERKALEYRGRMRNQNLDVEVIVLEEASTMVKLELAFISVLSCGKLSSSSFGSSIS